MFPKDSSQGGTPERGEKGYSIWGNSPMKEGKGENEGWWQCGDRKGEGRKGSKAGSSQASILRLRDHEAKWETDKDGEQVC